MHENNLGHPLPRRGRGLGDRGQGSKLKVGQAGDKESTPPAGTAAARSAGDQPGKPPAGFMFEKVCKCRRRLNAGDARGGAPCMK